MARRAAPTTLRLLSTGGKHVVALPRTARAPGDNEHRRVPTRSRRRGLSGGGGNLRRDTHHRKRAALPARPQAGGQDSRAASISRCLDDTAVLASNLPKAVTLP